MYCVGRSFSLWAPGYCYTELHIIRCWSCHYKKSLHATDSYYQPQTLSSLAAAAGGGGGQLDITTVITTLSSSVIL